MAIDLEGVRQAGVVRDRMHKIEINFCTRATAPTGHEYDRVVSRRSIEEAARTIIETFTTICDAKRGFGQG